MIALDERSDAILQVQAKIKVLGVGGAGTNIVSSIARHGIDDVELIIANTDARSLHNSPVKKAIQLGVKSTKGLGSGANPETGRRAAEEDVDKILEIVGDADVVFIAAGMGGGTGSGAAAVIAKAIRDRGILTIGIVTKPFLFEGKRRALIANKAIEELQKNIDTLLVVPNQKLLEIADRNISMVEAFEMVNSVLEQSVKGISYIITKPGHINVDFADLKAIIKDMGLAVMGTGRASGKDKMINAVKQAISSPLLENMSIEGARGVLFNITGGPDMGLYEIHEAASLIYEAADENANIIFGSVIDESLKDEVIVTVVATGFDVTAKKQEQAPQQVAPVLQQPAPQPAFAVREAALPKIEVALSSASALEEDDLDTPAFLRKQAAASASQQQENL